MANGKIVYTPRSFQALAFDETQYLSIDESDFNFGTGDFCLDALLYVDSSVTDSESWIVGKGASSLASVAGWHWYYTKADRKLNLRINDGDVAPTVISSSAPAFAFDTWFWAMVAVDRSGSAYLYVDGVLVGSGSVTAAAGSLDNVDLLKVGAYDAATNRHKGYVGMFRVDSGRLLDITWIERENVRLHYGRIRHAADFTALWTFDESLTDLSDSGYEFVLHGISPDYVSGHPVYPVSYTFDCNFVVGHSSNFLASDDQQRSLSGDLYVYAGPRKRQFSLDFQLCRDAQVDIFKAIWESGYHFDFYEDADLPRTCAAMMASPPEISSQGAGYWQVTLEMIET